MPNILDSIQVSGSLYDIKDKNAPSVSAVTQQEYDNLPSSAKTSNTFFVITDAQAGDLTQYWTSAQTQSAITSAVSGKVSTSDFNTYTAATDTALASKQTTLTAGTNITIVDNVISATGGGGKAVTGGTNISVTTGETADTINCTLPIKTNAWYSLTFNTSRNPSQVLYASAFGDYTTASGKGSFAIGKNTTASGEYSFVGGRNSSQAKGSNSFSFGDGTVTNGTASVAFGQNVTTKNQNEFSCGRLNKSVSTNLQFGDSGNTLFSVGNGTSTYHNAFEVKQNGDIYLSLNGQDVKLQDQLGGGGGATYSGGSGINIDSANTISAVYRGWAGERVQYLENMTSPFYMFRADDCVGSTFQVSFYINDIQTVVEFDVSAHTYTFIEGDSSWENYVVVEWDTTFGSFKATPNTSINVSDTSCARFSQFLYSGTTENAIDGTLDIIEYIKANGFGNNIEFAARDYENDLLIAPLTLNNVYPFQRSVSFSGGIKSIDGKISTQMQATPYKWMSGVTMWTCETSDFAVPSSSVTFNISRNPNDGLYVKDVNGDSFRIIDSSGNPDSTEYYTTVIDNGYVTVTALYSDRYIKLLGDNSCELDQYVSNLQYWGYETDTIPNVVLSIKDDLSGYVETSAITSSVTSASTDSEIPSAKAVNDKLGGLSLVKLSQSEYDSLATKDNSTLYVIVN